LNTEFLEINLNAYDKLLSRLRFLNKILPHNHEVLLYLSRVPTNDKRLHLATISQQTGIDFGRFQFKSDEQLEVVLVKVIQKILCHFATEENWHIRIVGVYTSNHLNDDGSLNTQNIIQTLVRLFENKMTHSKEEPEKFVAQYLIQCFQEAHHRFTENGNFQLWITKEIFYEFLLSGSVDITEIPENVLLQKFERVVQLLASNNLCILHYGGNHSNICVQFQFHNSNNDKEIFFWYPISNESERIQALEIRFPYFTPLFDIINKYFIYNIPPEFWLQKSPSTKVSDPGLTKELEYVLHQQLTVEINKQLDSLLELRHKFNRQCEENYNVIHTFFWLLEEWVMGNRLLGQLSETTMGTVTHFPRRKILHNIHDKQFLIEILQLRNTSPLITLPNSNLTVICFELLMQSVK
jgi:hemerythrin